MCGGVVGEYRPDPALNQVWVERSCPTNIPQIVEVVEGECVFFRGLQSTWAGTALIGGVRELFWYWGDFGPKAQLIAATAMLNDVTERMTRVMGDIQKIKMLMEET
jgi:hypothetical protein